ncbi:hypothetical protein LZC95_15345 [Pendulispora brunnea]|uniref:PEGA domain-containing protein n=1 Tax=Pendulispora brunnea TaxID=2905690 RepID=A0ABZ2KI23_9BACT
MAFRTRVPGLLAFALSMVTAGFVHAQPTPAEKDMARTLMGEGEEQRDRGDLEAALKSFQAADAIMHVPTTSLEVAKTQAALGRFLEAQEMVAAVLHYPVKRNEPRPFTVARDNAKALQEDLERRTPTILIHVAQFGRHADLPATLTLDGTTIPEPAPGTGRKVNPGHHVIAAQAGDASARMEIDILERETRNVTLKLGSPEQAPSPVATAPAIVLPPDNEPRKPNYLAYAGFGVGAAGVALGAITGIVVLANAGDLRDSCNKPPGNTCTGDDADKLSSTKTWATVSTVSFIVGGAGLAVGTLALVLGKSPSTPTRAAAPRVEPWFGIASAGVSGQF